MKRNIFCDLVPVEGFNDAEEHIKASESYSNSTKVWKGQLKG